MPYPPDLPDLVKKVDAHFDLAAQLATLKSPTTVINSLAKKTAACAASAVRPLSGSSVSHGTVSVHLGKDITFDDQVGKTTWYGDIAGQGPR